MTRASTKDKISLSHLPPEALQTHLGGSFQRKGTPCGRDQGVWGWNKVSSPWAFSPKLASQAPLLVWKAVIYGLFLTSDHRCPSFINLSLFLLSAIAHNWSTFKMSLILVLQCHNLTVIGVASTGSPGPEIDGVQHTNYILSI